MKTSEPASGSAAFGRTLLVFVLPLEHIPLKSIRFERQEYAPAFESVAISCRPGDSTRSTSALKSIQDQRDLSQHDDVLALILLALLRDRDLLGEPCPARAQNLWETLDG
jgi:hypothetical protein